MDKKQQLLTACETQIEIITSNFRRIQDNSNVFFNSNLIKEHEFLLKEIVSIQDLINKDKNNSLDFNSILREIESKNFIRVDFINKVEEFKKQELNNDSRTLQHVLSIEERYLGIYNSLISGELNTGRQSNIASRISSLKDDFINTVDIFITNENGSKTPLRFERRFREILDELNSIQL